MVKKGDKKGKKKSLEKLDGASLKKNDGKLKLGKKGRLEKSKKGTPKKQGIEKNVSHEKKVANGNAEKPEKQEFLTKETFDDLEIHPLLKQSLKEASFTHMTPIQKEAIPALLSGKDVLAQAKTGSGKTLAFLVPCIHLLESAKFKSRNGTGAIIITPTRELAIQIYGVVKELMKNSTQTHCLCIGGTAKYEQEVKLQKGCNIIVATPGRLLDHLVNTDFLYRNLQLLVLDEADRILEVGFEEELKAIVRRLPKERQTMLFSATQTEKIGEIANQVLNKSPVFIQIQEDNLSTVQALKQGYIISPQKDKLMLLISFLRRNKKKKTIVFFNTCDCVKYFTDLLTYMNIPVLELHGKLTQGKRTNTFFNFCNSKTGTLFCTNIAARGLDIPAVDWIIQYDPPTDTREYIHRVGRTARAGKKGSALLILTPEEKNYLRYLKAAKVPLNELEVGKNIVNLQSHIEEILRTNYYLNDKAKKAYQSYIYGYCNYSDKSIFNMSNLDMDGLVTQFGLESKPYVTPEVKKKHFN